MMARPATDLTSEFWRDPERRALFDRLYTEGLSYAEIGRRLGVSKNTISGRAWRDGKRRHTAAAIAGHRQFRALARALDRNKDALLLEAVNDLFRKYGKPAIAA
jgi:transposase